MKLKSIITVISFSLVILWCGLLLENLMDWLYISSYIKFENINHFSGYIFSTLPFAFGIYFFNRNNKAILDKSLKYLALIYLGLFLLILPYTKTRGDWLAGAVGLICILGYQYKWTIVIREKFDSVFKKVSAAAIVFLATVLVIFGLYSIRPSSAEGRLLIWKITTNMIAENPFFGKGLGSFGSQYNNYQAEYFRTNQGTEREKYLADNVMQVHNEYLQIWVEFGLAGLLLFFFLLYYLLSNRFDREDISEHLRFIIPAKAAIITVCITAVFSFPFHIIPTLINFVLFTAIVFSGKKSIAVIFKHRIARPVFILSIFFLASFVIYYGVNKYYITEAWKEAMRYARYGSYKVAINEFEKLEPALYDETDFLFNYGAVLSLNGQHNKAVKVLERAKNYSSPVNLFLSLGNSYKELDNFEEAEKNYLHASYIKPVLLYPRYLLAEMYVECGRIDDAKRIAEDVLARNAKVPSTAEREIKQKMKEILDM